MAFIVLTFGISQGSIALAAVAVGALVHQPLSRVPENIAIRFES